MGGVGKEQATKTKMPIIWKSQVKNCPSKKHVTKNYAHH
jgi:hypothetical protein